MQLFIVLFRARETGLARTEPAEHLLGFGQTGELVREGALVGGGKVEVSGGVVATMDRLPGLDFEDVAVAFAEEDAAEIGAMGGFAVVIGGGVLAKGAEQTGSPFGDERLWLICKGLIRQDLRQLQSGQNSSKLMISVGLILIESITIPV